MRFSLAAYRRLGTSRDVCVFMGRLWGEAAQTWSLAERAGFLHQQVANDLIQGDFWGCVEAFCARSPAEAVVVAERWLDSRPEPAALGVIANMIGLLRRATASDPSAAAGFAALEGRVQAAGYPAWRALYIQSRACSIGVLPVTEQDAVEMRERYIYAGAEEETPWCFLMNSVIRAERDAWLWAHRELMGVARPNLGEAARHFISHIFRRHVRASARRPVAAAGSPRRCTGVRGGIPPCAPRRPCATSSLRANP
jgi:hypothetical protein